MASWYRLPAERVLHEVGHTYEVTLHTDGISTSGVVIYPTHEWQIGNANGITTRHDTEINDGFTSDSTAEYITQYCSVDFPIDEASYNANQISFDLHPYIGGSNTPSYNSNYFGSWRMYAEYYTVNGGYRCRVYFVCHISVFAMRGDWILLHTYTPTVPYSPTQTTVVRAVLNFTKSDYTLVFRHNCSITSTENYSLTENHIRDHIESGSTETLYGIVACGRYGLSTDGLNDSEGHPYAQSNNGLWYRWQTNDTLIYFANDGGIDWSWTENYGVLNGELRYYYYNGTTREQRSLGTQQVGTTYTLPQSAGTFEHYTFSHWSYRGQTVSGTVQTYPNSSLLDSNWSGDTYTVSYAITSGASCLPSNPPTDSFTYPSVMNPPTGYIPPESDWLRLPSDTTYTISKDNYDYKGWSNDGGTTRYASGQSYLPVADTTFTTVFDPREYTVKFYDYGQNTPLYTQTVVYPNTVSIPNTASVQGFALKGWKKKNTQYDLIIEPNATSFQPTSNVVDLYQTLEVERVYQYTLSLYRRDSLASRTHIYTRMATFPETIQLPDSASTYTDGKIPAGYDLCGWTTEDYVYSKDIAKSGTYTFTTQYTVVNNTVVLQAIPLYYMALTPKELISLSIDTESITLVKGDTSNVSVAVNPPDWLGTVEWVAHSEDQQAGVYVDLQPNDRTITVSALEPTGTDTLTLTAQGRKKTWDVTSDYETDSVRIRIFDYVPISFFTKNDLGMDIPYDNNTYQSGGDETNTFFTSQDVVTSEWEWIEGPGTKLFPDNPPRTGYVFTGWVDADGNLIDLSHPPQNPINVYATWAGTYVDKDRDSLYLQLFNFDGNRMMKQYDMGIIQSNTETFNTGVSAQPTPTMTSVNTFITNLNCTESVSIKITRKSPDIIRDANNRILNDDSDDPLVWTNRRWLLEMRSLVDRWQSATDGIKLLYIPRGMKVIRILDQYAGIGDNYDLLGYVKEFSDDPDANNSGLLFEQDGETYVLTGYNGIISSYSDNYTATYRRVAEVSITFKLGGMKSKYQNWKDALVLLR